MFIDKEKNLKKYNEIKNLLETFQKGEMILAEKIYQIREEELYKPIFENFYLAVDDLGIPRRKASRLVITYQKFCVEFGMSLNEVLKFDYLKLYTIKDLCKNKEILDEWLNKAEVLPLRELIKEVKAEKTGSNAPDYKCSHAHTFKYEECKECGERWKIYDGKEN